MLNSRTAMRGLFALILAATTSGTLAQETRVLPPFIASSIAVIVNEGCCTWQKQDVPVPDSADREALEKLRDRAYRNGIVLQLQLDRDRSLKFIDNTSIGDTCEGYAGCRKHRLIEYWPKHRQYIVEVALWEGRAAFLVSARDGRLTPVSAPPVLSPSGRYAVAADLSPAYGNGLQIIDLDAIPPTVLDVKTMPVCPGTKPQSWLRPDPRWLDDTRIIFEGTLDPVQFDPDVKHILRIVDGRPEWEC